MPFLIYGEWGEYENAQIDFALVAATQKGAEEALVACTEAIADVRRYHAKGGGYSLECKVTAQGSPERHAVIAKSCALYDEAKLRLISLGVSVESNAHLCDSFHIAEVGGFPGNQEEKPAEQFTFTHAEFMQIRAYIADRDHGVYSGWYYGDKEQFEKRHAALRARFGLPANGRGE